MSTAIDRRANPAAAWMAAMRGGDFTAAWRLSDAVLAKRRVAGPDWDVSRHLQWVWDGRPLAGQRVLVRCYHGLGDTIQFARFLPVLAEQCRELTVWVQPPLIPLLERMAMPLKLLPLHDGPPDVHYDVDIEIMEITHALRTTLESLPRDVPYFAVEPAQRPDADLCVGLVAEAGAWDARRSVPNALMATLAEVPGMRAYSLQRGSVVPGAADMSTPDILALAARMRALDLVVTADTMTAHLAGALGVPTWTLLPAVADWRWMADRDDSPWYPTMRLFRQSAPGDWASVIGRVRQALGG